MAFGKKDPLRWKNFFICFAVCLGSLAYGYISAIIGTTLGKPAFLVYMNIGDEQGAYFPDKENLVGAITSVFQVLSSSSIFQVSIVMLPKGGRYCWPSL